MTVLLSPPDPGQSYPDQNNNIYRGDPVDVPEDQVAYMKDVHGFTDYTGTPRQAMDGPAQPDDIRAPVQKKAGK